MILHAALALALIMPLWPSAGSDVADDEEITIVQEAQHTVEYDANGGEGGIAIRLPDEYEYPIADQTQAGVKRLGHDFIGWALAPDGEVAIEPGDLLTVTGDYTLYAVWQHDGSTVCQITYEANGGLGSHSAEAVPGEEHTALTAEQADIARYGYEFIGWTAVRQGYPDTTVKPGEDLYINGDTVFYAGWQPDGETFYTVRYMANGGEGEYSASIIPERAHIIVSHGPAGIEWYGHELQGWAVAPAGAVEYMPGDAIVLDEDLTLYAVWAELVSPKPTVAGIDTDSTVLTGTGERGGLITVTWPAGQSTQIKVEWDGQWSMDIPEDTQLAAGQSISVIQDVEGMLTSGTATVAVMSGQLQEDAEDTREPRNTGAIMGAVLPLLLIAASIVVVTLKRKRRGKRWK